MGIVLGIWIVAMVFVVCEKLLGNCLDRYSDGFRQGKRLRKARLCSWQVSDCHWLWPALSRDSFVC